MNTTPRIDAHQHFWTLERRDYGWLTPETGSIYRDFQPQDLLPLINEAGISGTVLVQAAATVAETEYMLSLADSNDFIKGVVGWVDFEDIGAPDHIARLAEHPGLVGLRPMIQDIEDDNWMLREDLEPAFKALIGADLTFDALTLPRHLKNLHILISRHPEMRVVIDHASKPLISDGIIDDWADDMSALARDTNAYCKMSGLVTEAAENWTHANLVPYVDHLLDMFGPKRLIWGSDWPVCTLAASYQDWVAVTDRLLSDVDQGDKKLIYGGNAARVYKLDL